jgi:hypothetical protein
VADVVVLFVFDVLPSCLAVVLLLFEAPCCVLPVLLDDDVAVVVVPLPLVLGLLLAVFVLLDCEASCVLDEASVEEEGGDGGDHDEEVDVSGVEAGASCVVLLALCEASFWKSILCCKVCANGWALAALAAEFAVELTGELLEESNSEVINERGDMADPVYPVNPVNPVNVRSVPVNRVNRAIRSSEQSGQQRPVGGQTPSARILRIRAACSSASRCSRRACCWASAASPRACSTSYEPSFCL